MSFTKNVISWAILIFIYAMVGGSIPARYGLPTQLALSAFSAIVISLLANAVWEGGKQIFGGAVDTLNKHPIKKEEKKKK